MGVLPELFADGDDFDGGHADFLLPRAPDAARLATAHAPKGGITIAGQQFKGGEFIPADVLAQASDAERKAVGTKRPEGDNRPTPASLMTAFRKLDQGSNYVKLTDLHGLFPQTSVPELHDAIRELRKAGVMTVSAAEGRHGIDQKTIDTSIKEEGTMMDAVALRDGWQDAWKKMQHGGKKDPLAMSLVRMATDDHGRETDPPDEVEPPPAIDTPEAAEMTPEELARQVTMAFSRVSAKARRDLAAAVRTGTPDQRLARARLVVLKYRDELARVLTGAQLAALLQGMRAVAVKAGLPATAETPRPGEVDQPEQGEAESVTLPVIENAVRDLASRAVVDQEAYAALSEEAQARAFTVAGIESEAVLTRIKDALAETVGNGGTLEDFARKVEGENGESVFASDHQEETVFRTAVQTAYNGGLAELASHPLIADQFPYVETLPIKDSRLTALCEVISYSGLDGTGVYNAQDPIWKKFAPPRHHRCRCSTNYLTVEEAARRGVREAQEWLASGIPPESPEFVAHPPVDLPKGWQPGALNLSTVRLGWVQRGTSRTGKPRWWNDQTHQYRYQQNMPGTGRARKTGAPAAPQTATAQTGGGGEQPAAPKTKRPPPKIPFAKKATEGATADAVALPAQPKATPDEAAPAPEAPKGPAHVDLRAAVGHPDSPFQKYPENVQKRSFGENLPEVPTVAPGPDTPFTPGDHARAAKTHIAAAKAVQEGGGDASLSDGHLAAADWHMEQVGKAAAVVPPPVAAPVAPAPPAAPAAPAPVMPSTPAKLAPPQEQPPTAGQPSPSPPRPSDTAPRTPAKLVTPPAARNRPPLPTTVAHVPTPLPPTTLHEPAVASPPDEPDWLRGKTGMTWNAIRSLHKEMSDPAHPVAIHKDAVEKAAFGKGGASVNTVRKQADGGELSADEHKRMASTHAKAADIHARAGNDDRAEAHRAAADWHRVEQGKKAKSTPAEQPSTAPPAAPVPPPPAQPKPAPVKPVPAPKSPKPKQADGSPMPRTPAKQQKTAREAQAPQPLASRPEHQDAARGQRKMSPASQAFHDKHVAAIDTHPSLSPEQKQGYKKAMGHVMARMPDKAVARMQKNVSAVTYHASGDEIMSALRREIATGIVAKHGGSLEETERMVRTGGLEGTKAAGAFHGGRVILDGDARSSADLGGDSRSNTHETYAHELAHAIDGKDFELSSSDDWQQAWQDEIARQRDTKEFFDELKEADEQKREFRWSRLSQYAETDAREGFAEFGRLLYGTDVDRALIEKAFPRAAAFFKKHGIWT